MNLIGKQAPDFQSKAVVNGQIVDSFSLSQFKGKHVVLFFYPLDFTFVAQLNFMRLKKKDRNLRKKVFNY